MLKKVGCRSILKAKKFFKNHISWVQSGCYKQGSGEGSSWVVRHQASFAEGFFCHLSGLGHLGSPIPEPGAIGTFRCLHELKATSQKKKHRISHCIFSGKKCSRKHQYTLLISSLFKETSFPLIHTPPPQAKTKQKNRKTKRENKKKTEFKKKKKRGKETPATGATLVRFGLPGLGETKVDDLQMLGILWAPVAADAGKFMWALKKEKVVWR